MKLKNITIIYTIFLLILIVIGVLFYRQKEDTSSYLPELHKNITEIQKLYENGSSIESLESDYHCTILLCDDEEYSKVFWQSIEKMQQS